MVIERPHVLMVHEGSMLVMRHISSCLRMIAAQLFEA